MRRLLMLVVLVFGVAAPGVALAQAPAPSAAQQTDEAKVFEQQLKSGQVIKGEYAEAPRSPRGSGFWTSNVPTPNHPYRWSYMAVGMGICAVMGLFVFTLIRRAARQRHEAEGVKTAQS